MKKHFTLPLGEASFNELFRHYKRNAKVRGYLFELTKSQFKYLTSSKCHYCGVVPSIAYRPSRCNGAYVYNGLDRVDNKKGYSLNNCVPCCKIHNKMKHDMTTTEFYGAIKAVYEHSCLGSIKTRSI